MCSTFDTVPVPVTSGYSEKQRAAVAYELRALVVALHQRSGVLYDGCQSRAIFAITELNAVAALCQRRAAEFEYQDR